MPVPERCWILENGDVFIQHPETGIQHQEINMKSVPDKNTPVLVVDDDTGLLLSIKATLLSAGMPEPALVSDSRRVMELVRTHNFQLVLLDLIMPYFNGMEILIELKETFPEIECVIVTAIDEVPSAVQAMKYGAYDYLVKPLDVEKLVIVINHAIERYSLRHRLSLFETRQSFSELENPVAFQKMVTEDEAMAIVFHQAETAAATDYSLIITGETGTGKELLARIIHNLSRCSDGPFVAVNMSSFSKTLFEDDFFGHIKGAYTGAHTEKKGFFEAAQGGTLFMDEITDLVPELQVKLLRVIEEKELYRLGSTQARYTDVRIITATNKNFKEEIRIKRFREDLFYRLNMFHIHIPPLRERKKDILLLANHFLRIHTIKCRKEIQSLSPELRERLQTYPLPGNVRELEHIIASAVLLENGNVLTLSSASNMNSLDETVQKSDEFISLAELEKTQIFRVLEATNGNRTRAAKILGIGLRTLQRKLMEYENQPPR